MLKRNVKVAHSGSKDIIRIILNKGRELKYSLDEVDDYLKDDFVYFNYRDCVCYSPPVGRQYEEITLTEILMINSPTIVNFKDQKFEVKEDLIKCVESGDSMLVKDLRVIINDLKSNTPDRLLGFDFVPSYTLGCMDLNKQDIDDMIKLLDTLC